MYSLLFVDDERLELETLRDYTQRVLLWMIWFDRVYTARREETVILRPKPDVMITDILTMLQL